MNRYVMYSYEKVLISQQKKNAIWIEADNKKVISQKKKFKYILKKNWDEKDIL